MEKRIIFGSVPENVSQMKLLPQATLKDPFDTAALTALILCRYGESREDCIEMLNFLKGPSPLSNYDIQFLRDRLGGAEYLPFSFFEGSSLDNGYKPSHPFTVTVNDNPYSYSEDGYVTLYLTSSGADNARPLKMRQKKSTGEWFLTEVTILSQIRIPKEADPWA